LGSKEVNTMKTHNRNLLNRVKAASRDTWACHGATSNRSRALLALIAGLSSGLACPSSAQIFTTLHSFDSDGPPTGLILSGKALCGTTTGTVFAVNTDGSGFTNLHSFTDGASLSAGLILSSNTLYGTTYGGSSSNGTVFKVNTDGTGFTNLHTFTVSAPFTNSDGYVVYTNSDGANPSGLVLSNNTLYGTANGGGGWGEGTVFGLNTDGTGFTNLHQFTSLIPYQVSTDPTIFLNSDGAAPGGLVLSSNTLFITTYVGGGSGQGTLFALNTDGTGFTNLYDFPRARLMGGSHSGVILSSNTLYGAATYECCQTGPSSQFVFALNTDGSSFRTLYTNWLQGLVVLGDRLYGAVDGYSCLMCQNNSWPAVVRVNTDGSGSTNLLIFDNLDYNYLRVSIQLGDTLYGISLHGRSLPGGNGGYGGKNGTVFTVNTDGTSFTVLHSFTAVTPSPSPQTNSDGADPNSLVLSNNTLYGTTTRGGSGGSGTIFSISLPPQLTIIPSGVPPSGIILTWPTNAFGFTLQSTTNLDSPAVWVTNSPAPVVIGDQNVVTNPIPGPQQFYRLVH
jgi:uncharacterized repeat protein (TIGR03803 family)